MKTPSGKKKNFLNLPTYPGGKKAFNAFIKENLVYPEEALEGRVEGDVLVTYEVDDNGVVSEPKLKHGIGHGCDEEALRLIGLLRFPKTTNRGLRVRSRFTTRIPFRLPVKDKTTRISYSMAVKKEETKAPPDKPAPGQSYTWQIPLSPGKEPTNP